MRCARSFAIGCLTVVGMGVGALRMLSKAYAMLDDHLVEFEDAVADEVESWRAALS